uniref:ANK_REP_REGION domain-containing protein n=1 Tax=Panagrellus redivivus TaxID=6233 RepID=A0A7E4URR7_PANRE
MLHHGNDANGTFRPIHAAIDLLKRMQMVDVDLEKDEPMDYATSELSEDDYVFDLIDADVNDIIHAVHGDDGDAVVHYVPDVVVSSLQVVNGAFHNAELFNVDDDADNSIFADLDAFGDTAEEIDEDSAKIDAFWASINAEKAYFSQHL